MAIRSYQDLEAQQKAIEAYQMNRNYPKLEVYGMKSVLNYS